MKKWKIKWKIKIRLNKNIGMSVYIAVIDTAQKWNKMKFLNRNIEIEILVTENDIRKIEK